jgi:hypothetical protein
MTSSVGLSVSQVFFSKWIEPGIRLIRNAQSSKQLINLKFFSPSSFAFNSVRVILFIKVDRKIWLGWQSVSITFCKENENGTVTQIAIFPDHGKGFSGKRNLDSSGFVAKESIFVSFSTPSKAFHWITTKSAPR